MRISPVRSVDKPPKGTLVPKILIADDNSNIQKMVALAFEDHKIEVVAVSNGEAAVKKLADVKPDLILADVFMPVRNGYEVCEFVKKDARFAAIPVILLVGAFDPLDEIEAKRVSADGVLKKPFVPPDPLISLVTELLAKNAKPEPKAKEVASPPPSLMPRKPQAPVPDFSEPAEDDAYLVGKGRHAYDDEKWQNVTAKSESSSAAPVPSAAKSFVSVAADTPEERSFSETHADVRRRTEIDHETVPSFSSALVGEAHLDEHQAKNSDQRPSVVPNPKSQSQLAAQAEAQRADAKASAEAVETNWAALVKSFTAAPLSISDPPPVFHKHEAEPEPAIASSAAPVAPPVAPPAEASSPEKKPESKATSPKVTPEVPSEPQAKFGTPALKSHPAEEPGQATYEAAYEAASLASAPITGAAEANGQPSSGSAYSSELEAASTESKNAKASDAASSPQASASQTTYTVPLRDEAAAHNPATEASTAFEASAKPKANAAPQASQVAEAQGRSPIDESLWAKVAMQASLPSEPPALVDYEARSDTAAQMIAAATEAAETARRDFFIPSQPEPLSQAPATKEPTTSRLSSFSAFASAAPAVAPAPAPTPSAVIGYAEPAATIAPAASAAATQVSAASPASDAAPVASAASTTAVEEPPSLSAYASEPAVETPSVSEAPAPSINEPLPAASASPEPAPAAYIAEQPAAGSSAATESQSTAVPVTAASVDEIVARVLERIAPQIQELISKGVIRPLVEEVLRTPDSRKK
jgi:CheY-like chemotaxis protein